MYRSPVAVRLIAEIEAVPAILEVVCRTTGMGFAAVAQVTENRWIACSVRDEIELGVKTGSELAVETTICKQVHDALEPVIISDAEIDPVYSLHPTPSAFGFRSYISTPIVLPGGEVFGTLCAMDREPRDLSSPWLINMFKLFSDIIAFQLDAHLRLAAGADDLADSRRTLAVSRRDLAASAARLTASRANLARSRADLASSQGELAASRIEATAVAANLVDERAASELREQFIAVLGHDLRNPLASIAAGAKLLAKESISERGKTILALLDKSVGRMAGLIDDVLDFARGRLGGGIAVEARDVVPLAPMLRQVVDEVRNGHPEREIDVDIEGISDCRCDAGRIGQLLSNLVANAITHGEPGTPVKVYGRDEGGAITLSVTNGGPPIPPSAMAGLFKPFVRASARPSQQGLGLGLYIASEIAKAHSGTLEAVSNPEATTFTFQMPSGD